MVGVAVSSSCDRYAGIDPVRDAVFQYSGLLSFWHEYERPFLQHFTRRFYIALRLTDHCQV